MPYQLYRKFPRIGGFGNDSRREDYRRARVGCVALTLGQTRFKHAAAATSLILTNATRAQKSVQPQL